MLLFADELVEKTKRIKLTTFVVGADDEYNQEDYWDAGEFGYPILQYQELDKDGEVSFEKDIDDLGNLMQACVEIIS